MSFVPQISYLIRKKCTFAHVDLSFRQRKRKHVYIPINF